jgi:hypothetical protein
MVWNLPMLAFGGTPDWATTTKISTTRQFPGWPVAPKSALFRPENAFEHLTGRARTGASNPNARSTWC